MWGLPMQGLLIAGSNSGFLWRVAFGSFVLALLLSGFALLSLALRARKLVKARATKQTLMQLPTIPLTARTEQRIDVSKMLLVLLFGLTVGAIEGWTWAGYQYTKDRHTYTDVLILTRHDARHFTVQPARMAPWETGRLCSDVDWQAGEKMRILTYKQKDDCKDVSARGAYAFYYDAQGKRTNLKEIIANAGY